MVPLHELVPLWDLMRQLGRPFQRRPESLTGRKNVTIQDNNRCLPGAIIRLSVNTRATSGSFHAAPAAQGAES
jgi:hypothetical protein